jgi:hypothetical protein
VSYNRVAAEWQDEVVHNPLGEPHDESNPRREARPVETTPSLSKSMMRCHAATVANWVRQLRGDPVKISRRALK